VGQSWSDRPCCENGSPTSDPVYKQPIFTVLFFVKKKLNYYRAAASGTAMIEIG
jgi:hypothetical protein